MEIKKSEVKDLKQKLVESSDIFIAEEDESILKEFQDVSVSIKELQERQNLIKQDVVEILEDYDLTSYEGEKGLISYTKASTREGIDSKKLKAELPAIAEQYKKLSSVSASVRFKAK